MRRFLIAALLMVSVPLVAPSAEVQFEWQEAVGSPGTELEFAL